jgi:hypothetical protein
MDEAERRAIAENEAQELEASQGDADLVTQEASEQSENAMGALVSGVTSSVSEGGVQTTHTPADHSDHD